MPAVIFVALLLAWPIAEIAALIAVGREVGILATIALLIFTTFLGAVLLRLQGFATLSRIRREMQAGEVPTRSIGHAALIAVGALLLLLPGFVSDVFGLLLFLPPVRSLILALLGRRASVVVIRRSGMRRRAGVVDLDPEEWSVGGGRGPQPGPGAAPARPALERPDDSRSSS